MCLVLSVELKLADNLRIATGKYRNQVPDSRFEKIDEQLEIIPVNIEVADKAGEIMARLMDQEETIGINDSYIAATALLFSQPVVTADTDDFEKTDVETIDWNQL